MSRALARCSLSRPSPGRTGWNDTSLQACSHAQGLRKGSSWVCPQYPIFHAPICVLPVCRRLQKQQHLVAAWAVTARLSNRCLAADHADRDKSLVWGNSFVFHGEVRPKKACPFPRLLAKIFRVQGFDKSQGAARVWSVRLSLWENESLGAGA